MIFRAPGARNLCVRRAQGTFILDTVGYLAAPLVRFAALVHGGMEAALSAASSFEAMFCIKPLKETALCNCSFDSHQYIKTIESLTLHVNIISRASSTKDNQVTRREQWNYVI